VANQSLAVKMSESVSLEDQRFLQSYYCTYWFYETLRNEVIGHNPYLSWTEQAALQSHYPRMLKAAEYPSKLAATIYSNRRAYAIQTIQRSQDPVVFDAGCGYGSECFLFASQGAKVIGIDLSDEQIEVARKRQPYYEEIFGKPLDIQFIVGNLDESISDVNNISLTWLASVLAAVGDQNKFLERTYEATRGGGQIIVTDMNLFNPLFLIKEYYRRQQAKSESIEFALRSDFWAMVKRQGRIGARYFPGNNGRPFDDVQFFSAKTLSRLLSNVGFTLKSVRFNGFVPPHLWQVGFGPLEDLLSRTPLLRWFGYFYLCSAMKQ